MEAHKKVAPSVIWSIIGTAGVACSGILVETSMNVTFPTLMKVFNQSLNNVQWRITTAYLLAVTLTIVLAAYLQRSFKFKSWIIAAGTAWSKTKASEKQCGQQAQKREDREDPDAVFNPA